MSSFGFFHHVAINDQSTARACRRHRIVLYGTCVYYYFYSQPCWPQITVDYIILVNIFQAQYYKLTNCLQLFLLFQGFLALFVCDFLFLWEWHSIIADDKGYCRQEGREQIYNRIAHKSEKITYGCQEAYQHKNKGRGKLYYKYLIGKKPFHLRFAENILYVNAYEQCKLQQQ